MSQATIDRKRKLQEIRERSNKKANENNTKADAEEKKEKTIKFRNYQPRDVSLIKAYVTTENEEKNKSDTVQHETNDNDIIKKELRQFSEDDELNILPKSNNWDLKKQLEPKLEKLRRRTQRAIVDILREKIANEVDSDSDSDDINDEL